MKASSSVASELDLGLCVVGEQISVGPYVCGRYAQQSCSNGHETVRLQLSNGQQVQMNCHTSRRAPHLPLP